jgi:predicted component of type VI protein secretion system
MKVNLVVVQGKPEGMEIPLRQAEFLIGRERDCHLRPTSELISKRHCRIKTDGVGVTVEDLGSKNGTFVNGNRIDEAVAVTDGDLIKVGPLVFAVKIAAAAASAQPLAKKDDDIVNWLVGESGSTSSPDASLVSGDSTIMDLPVGKLAAAGDTVHDGDAPPENSNGAEKSAEQPAGKKPAAKKKDIPDTSVAASAILAKYLDRRRSSS